MKNIFTDHPHSIGESYLQHLKFAGKFGISMTLGGLACCIHACLPFLFKNTGSNVLLKMSYNFVERMPHLEGRTLELANLIATKKTKTPKAS